MNENSQPDWNQIAAPTPRLQRHIVLYPQDYRGDRWYVLHNKANDTPIRVNEEAYAFIGRFDGKLTVQENSERTQKALGANPSTPQEMVMILTSCSRLVRWVAVLLLALRASLANCWVVKPWQRSLTRWCSDSRCSILIIF